MEPDVVNRLHEGVKGIAFGLTGDKSHMRSVPAFVTLLDRWNFNGLIYQHFEDLLKVLDRALSNYFVELLDCWKFNGFIY